jgi:hypothetical protein
MYTVSTTTSSSEPRMRNEENLRNNSIITENNNQSTLLTPSPARINKYGILTQLPTTKQPNKNQHTVKHTKTYETLHYTTHSLPYTQER